MGLQEPGRINRFKTKKDAQLYQARPFQRWRLILEKYGPDLRYIQGEIYIVADALLRLEIDNNSVVV